MTQTTMRELLEKMRPLLNDPPQAQRLWNLWLVEHREGREWIEQMLEIEYNRLVRPLEKRALLLPPPPKDSAAGEIRIGDVVYNDRVLYPFGIPDKTALLQHTAIFGRSGAGKTNLVFKLLSEVSKQDVPFWILDWKRDSRPLLGQKDKKTLVFTIGREPSPLPFNPLLPPIGCSAEIERHIGKVMDIIGRAFYVGHGVKALLSRAFHALLQKWKADPENNPVTFQAALKWIRDYSPGPGSRRRVTEWKESTIRALEQLCMGLFGRALNVRDSMALDSVLPHNVIFELDGLDSDQKLFFTEVLLLWLRERFLADLDSQPREQLRLLLVVEEAHNVLRDRNGTSAVREKGEGLYRRTHAHFS